MPRKTPNIFTDWQRIVVVGRREVGENPRADQVGVAQVLAAAPDPFAAPGTVAKHERLGEPQLAPLVVVDPSAESLTAIAAHSRIGEHERTIDLDTDRASET